MLNIKLPNTYYETTTYPNLDSTFDGAPIPLAYGNLHGVVPVCVNTSTHLYKVAGHAIHSIDEIRADAETLVVTADYTADLANGQFTLLETPYLAANTTYYMVFEADYVVSGTNHIHLKQFGSTYGNGSLFTIDGSSVWSADASHDLRFQVYGKPTLDGQERIKVRNNIGTATNVGLKDDAARTRLAQSFKTGASGFYCTRINVWHSQSGAPTGNLRVAILSAYTPAEVQLGAKSIEHEIDRMGTCRFFFPLRAEVSNIQCDIEGAEKSAATIVDGADFLEDLVETRLGKAVGVLDATTLADFKTNRTQTIKAYLDKADTTFGSIVGKLESSLLFKLIPLHDGTYAPTVYASGTPAGTPHFFDEHFLSFSMRHNFADVKATVNIKYDEDPGTNEYKVSSTNSNVAKFVYGNYETLDVETYLASGANAATLATSYSGMYQTPPLEITFEIRGYGLNLIPGRDKVKITRTHAAYAGGTIAGVLFRIVRITKHPAAATTEITAILDTQTY